MLQVHRFTFNVYQENTFVISDESGACVIIDPGCYAAQEETALKAYIRAHKLQVEKLLNTHGHIDHMLGNKMVVDQYKVPFEAHPLIQQELEAASSYGPMMGLSPAPSPMPDRLLTEGDIVSFGNTELEVLFTPGHSPSHISFFHRESQQLFSGDVLFQGSIGRTDLPGGSFSILMETIRDKFLPLDDKVQVQCGHGPATTIGAERRSNPFILQHLS